MKCLRCNLPSQGDAMLTGKTVLLLVEEQFNDQEFWYPFYRLKEAGATVVVTGSGSAAQYRGKAGTVARADVAADAVKADGCDGVVIPGGYAPDFMRRYPSMVRLVREIFNAGKPVAAICHAGWMLASAGICAGRKLTSFFAIRDDLVHAGATWVDREVVVDGRLITSRTPDDLPAFMRAVIEALAASPAAKPSRTARKSPARSQAPRTAAAEERRGKRGGGR
jgi:protease I